MFTCLNNSVKVTLVLCSDFFISIF